MKVEFEFKKCIYCLNKPPDSWEHIISQSIGGRLKARLLCSECNHLLGYTLVDKIKNDPSIRLAVRNLKYQIPRLFDAIEKGQIYDAKGSDDSHVKLRYKNAKLEVLAHRKEDGSLVLDTQKGLRNISQMLRKEGLSEDEISRKIHSFEQLEENKIIQLSTSVRVVKWSIDSVFPNLQGPLLNEKVIALIAYEFLALLVGNSIYSEKLEFIREFIRGGDKPDKIVIEQLTSRHYDPYHKIYPERSETEIVVNIILFRWLVYKVHLRGLALAGLNSVYLEDLQNRKTLIARSVDEAKRGVYYSGSGIWNRRSRCLLLLHHIPRNPD
jgi:hypothetical protein